MSGDSSCCVDCHFDWEEEHAIGYLPPMLQRQLLDEHKALRDAGMPGDAVLAHAEREMAWFRAHCPPHVVAKIDADHKALEPSLMHNSVSVGARRRLRLPRPRV